METITSFGSRVRLGTMDSGVTPAMKLDVTAGRKAADEEEMIQALKANGLLRGSLEWCETYRCGKEATKLNREREARTMSVLSKDGQFVLDWDYRAAATMQVEQP